MAMREERETQGVLLFFPKIFTTLLDLFSVESEWKGLGRSLLNAETYEDVNTEKVKEISNLIIRSNWFEKK